MVDPEYAQDYYQILNGRWKDNTQMIYGGNGHVGAGGYGPACRFMFPGESDTQNWGVGCVPPNGPVNWTEETALNNPYDRRGLGSTGPFTFKPGDVQDIDIAFSWARDYVNPPVLGSIGKLRQVVDVINKAFTTNQLPNGEIFYGVGDHLKSPEIPVNIYPNPSSVYLNIVPGNETFPAGTILELMTSQGIYIKSLLIGSVKSFHLDISDIPSGFYFIRLTSNESMAVKKVVIIH
jgi:hypothetical protein